MSQSPFSSGEVFHVDLHSYSQMVGLGMEALCCLNPLLVAGKYSTTREKGVSFFALRVSIPF